MDFFCSRWSHGHRPRAQTDGKDPPPVAPDLLEAVTASDPTIAARDRLRRDHRVRLVTAEEEGYGVNRLPAGVYGFTYAPLGEMPLFRKESYHSFEVHKTSDGQWHLIAFVTVGEADAGRAARSQLEIHLYPDPWNESTDMVSLAGDRIAARKLLPSREPGNWIAVTVYPRD